MKFLLALIGICWWVASDHAIAEQLPHSVVLLDNGTPASIISKDTSAKRFWTDVATQSIRVSGVDGTDERAFLSGLATPYGIAFDRQNENFIWTSSEAEEIRTTNLTGNIGFVSLLSSFEPPFAIVLEYDDGSTVSEEPSDRAQTISAGGYKIVYTLDDKQIKKITQHSDNIENIIEVLAEIDVSYSPWGLAYDARFHQLYIGDPWGRMVKRLDIASNTLSTLDYEEYTPHLLEPIVE